MKVYVMRHGTTVWNEKGIIQGYSANRLSALGKVLVENVAKRLKDEKLEVIFSSPLFRTIQTSNIMNKYHNVKIIKDKRLIEEDAGIFTGRYRSSITQEEMELRKEGSPKLKLETRNQVLNRCYGFVAYLKTLKYNNVLIVTHGIVAKFLEEIFLNQVPDFAKSSENSFKNAQIKEFYI